jgi:hypothetical protein
MKNADLQKMYEGYLRDIVKSNPLKYSNMEALEDDIAVLYEAWASTKTSELDGKSPTEYVEELFSKHVLCDYIEDLLEAGIEVSDLASEMLINDSDAGELLARLCYSNIKDAPAFAAEILKLAGGQIADETFIEALTNPNASEVIKLAGYEYLSNNQPQVVDKILEILPTVPEDQQSIFVEILSEYKGNKAIYFWLVTMLFRADDVPLYADLLAKYEDPAAIDILKSFAHDNPTINYMEFRELRYAVERLGGEWEMKKDFSEDPLYKFENPVKDDENGGNSQQN